MAYLIYISHWLSYSLFIYYFIDIINLLSPVKNSVNFLISRIFRWDAINEVINWSGRRITKGLG